MSLEVNSLSLGDLTTTGKGTKQIPLRCKDGLLKFQPGPLRVLWQPQAYNDPTATRVPICFEATPEVEDYFNTLDEWMIKALAAGSQSYFGNTLTADQVRDKYTSSLKTSQKGYKHLKAKMNIAGRASARFWSLGANKPGPPPEDWTNCTVEPILEIRGLWFLGKEMGLLVELTDALVTENSVTCPFG
jgi:hypothetical protein